MNYECPGNHAENNGRVRHTQRFARGVTCVGGDLGHRRVAHLQLDSHLNMYRMKVVSYMRGKKHALAMMTVRQSFSKPMLS